MAGRSTFFAFLAVCLFVPVPLRAQTPSYAAGPNSWGPPQHGSHAGGWGPGPGGPYPTETYVGSRVPRQPFQYATPATAIPGAGYYGPDNIVTTATAERDDRRLDRHPVERWLSFATKKSWFRLEGLLWEVQNPGAELLGHPIDIPAGPGRFFPVFDDDAGTITGTAGTFIGQARVSNLGRISFRDKNGIRGTWGIPLTFGAFEMSGFLLEQASDTERATFLPDTQLPGSFAATTALRSGGRTSTPVALYDNDFRATYTNDTWGADFRFVLNHFARPGEGLKWQPLIGVRYLSIQEALLQKGVFDRSGTQAAKISVINSDTRNNLFGPQLGVRGEFVHRWFVLGIEPKVSAGVNVFKQRVFTERLLDINEGRIVQTVKDASFSPVAELHAYIKFPVRENIQLHFGYNALWAMRVLRPHNIDYNIDEARNLPAFGVARDLGGLRLHGITFGGQITF